MKRIALLLSALLLLVSLPVRAQVPPEQGALILLRILAYDRRLAAATDKPVRIGVVYRLGLPSAEREANEMVAALAAAAKRIRVAGRIVEVIPLPYSAQAFAPSIGDAKLSTVVVGSGLEREVPLIFAATRKHKVLSLTMDEPLAGSGLSIAVTRRGERAVILVDLAAARAEGADLSAGLLRLAEVLRR